MRTVNHQKRAEKTAAIVRSAAGVFADKGFHQAGMQEVCQVAQTSPGAMYTYFSSKTEIIRAVSEDAMRSRHELATALSGAVDPVDVLLVDVKREVPQQDAAIEVEVYAESLRNAEVREITASARKSIVSVLADILARKGIREEDARNAAQYIATVLQAIRLQKTTLSHDDLDGVIKQFEQTLHNIFQDNTLWKKAAGRFSTALFSRE